MPPLLLSHLIIACLTFITGISVWIYPNITVKTWFRILYLISLTTGLLLSLGDPLTLQICGKFGIYLFLIALTEYRMTLVHRGNTVHDGI